ncbi:MAG: RNA polymerase Rpb4 [Candidatus Bathyarchaeia archaeon]
MPRKAIKERIVTVPEVKKILESIGEEHLDQFQRRSLDYAAKFSKVEPNVGKKLVKKLMDEFEVEEEEAVQIVNCMPESIEEIRVFLGGGRKIIETSKLQGILALLNEHKREK